MSRVFALRQVIAAMGAALTLGALSTMGDWVWARWIPDGAILPAVVHGLLFFAALALVLGRAAGSSRVTRRLLLTLPPTGLVLAAVFYPLAGVIGYLGALLATWTGMWLALALLLRRALRSEGSIGRAVVRGGIAAAGSGLAFWAVSGMWTQPAHQTGYGLRLAYWSVAFLPGLLALLASSDPGRRP